MMGDYADMEIDRGMDEDWPFGTPTRRQRRKLPGNVQRILDRAAMEARAKACDEIAGVRECQGLDFPAEG